MTVHDESQLAEPQAAFLRHLAHRVEVIGRRLQRFMTSGWDINGLSLMHREMGQLGDAGAQYGLGEASGQLLALRDLLALPLAAEDLPDAALGERVWSGLDTLRGAVPRPVEPRREAPRQLGGSTRAETPPPNYWRRWGDHAPPPDFDALRQPEPVPVPTVPVGTTIALPQPPMHSHDDFDAWDDAAPRFGPTPVHEHEVVLEREIVREHEALPGMEAVFEREAVTDRAPQPRLHSVPAPVPEPAETGEPVRLNVAAGFRIYHLTRYGTLSLEIDHHLEAQGMEVELLDNAEELRELLGALPANLVVIDPGFTDELEAIGEVMRQARQRTNTKMLLAAISDADDMVLRLSARRAGVDALIVAPASAAEVLRRLQSLVDPDREAPFRILVVEDDRSQALFAEGILRNAGMESLVVLDSLGVLPALENFQPDLILMDLNMPDASGIELTALIRENEAFIDTPIVFLSGESDQDRQFDAIDAGGDDFLAKPIRPRHLISAVQNRVRRHRAMTNRRDAATAAAARPTGRSAATGLYDRGALLERIAAHLANCPQPVPGGLLFLEIESSALLRERLGLSALEQLMTDVSKMVVEKVGEAAVARFGDGSFLVFDAMRDENELEALANAVRNALVAQPFQAQGHPLRLRVSVGVCALHHGFAELGQALNAVEKVGREARTFERGVRRYEPPKAAEAQREASLLKQLREAIDLQQLELLYQPVVAVAGSDDSQFQALLRLRDSAGKLRSAAEIIPMAEAGDFIVDIDRWVMLQALKLIRDRRADGRPLRLFVTQSPMTLSASGQSAWLKAELAAHEVPGTSLVIELRLEDAAVHAATVRQFCEAMVEDGTQFCLSQFESGPESEPLLEQLPLGFVKLARKYTAGNMSQNVRDELKLLITRAHRRGLEVIGHGVEDAQAAATLWMSGIDFIQGNLVSQANQDLDFDFHQAVL